MNITNFLNIYSKLSSDYDKIQHISPNIIQNVQYIVEKLSNIILIESDIGIGTNGSVGVLWENENIYIYINFIPNDKIHYYYQIGIKPYQEDAIDGYDIGILCNQINCEFIK